MYILCCLLVLPAVVCGRFAVRGHDIGCALSFAACAGILTACGPGALCPSQPLLCPAAFVLCLVLAAPAYLHEKTTPNWRENWRLWANNLRFSLVSLAFFGGLCHHIVGIPVAGFALGLMLTLAGLPCRAARRSLVAAAGIPMLCAVLPVPAWLAAVGSAAHCACCLLISGFLLLPAAEYADSNRQNHLIYCLFVFLTYYYTFCI